MTSRRVRGRGRRVGSPAHALAPPRRAARPPPALREIAGDPTRHPWPPSRPDVALARVSVAAYRIPTNGVPKAMLKAVEIAEKGF